MVLADPLVARRTFDTLRPHWLLLPAPVPTDDQRRDHYTGADEQGLQDFR